MSVLSLRNVLRLAVLFAPVLASAAPGATWRVRPLSLPIWYGASCSAIDSRGRIAGTAKLAPDEFGQAGFLHNGQLFRTWGIIDGEDPTGANALSDHGLVVGKRITDRTFGFHKAIIFREHGPRDLPPLTPMNGSSEALGVNIAGDIVGVAASADGSDHAVRWHDDTVTDLAPGSRDSRAVAINAAGTIVGSADGAMVSFTAAGPVPLAGLEAATGVAGALNNAGVVAGYTVDASGLRRAYTWQAGTVTPLPTPDGEESVARGLNNAGTVVGYVRSGATSKGVVWLDGDLIVLDDALAPGAPAGWHITDAGAINDAGQICATASKPHEYPQVVLLKPVH